MSDNPEETAYYLRLMSMYMDLCTESVRNVFNYYSPGRNGEAFLQSNQTKLKELKAKHILNQPECDLVITQLPDIRRMDISLLITLSINLFSDVHLQPPAKGWDNPPKGTDLSIAADLLRLRKIRNVIVGHYPCAQLPKWIFDENWKDIEEILLRIESKINEGNEIQRKIESYRLQKLDPSISNEHDTKLKEWHHELSEAQKQVDDYLEKLRGFNVYLKEKSDRYERYIKLLVKGGRRVLSALIETKCQQRDLRSKLDEKEDVLRQNITNVEHLRILYPSDRDRLATFDMSVWDISLLAGVLLYAFECSDDLKEVIVNLYNARKNYAEMAVMSLDPDTFVDCLSDLKNSISVAKIYLSAKAKTEINDILEESKKSSKEDSSFKTYMDELELHGSKMKTFSDIHKETVQKTKDALQEMITRGISFDRDRMLELKMITVGSDEEKKKIAETILFEVWQAALDRSKEKDDFQEIQQEVNKILGEIKKTKNVKDISVNQSCILLQIACMDPSDILALIEYFESEKFHKTLDDICKEAGYHLNTTVAICSKVTIESLHGILNASNAQKLSKHSNTQITLETSTDMKDFNDVFYGETEQSSTDREGNDSFMSSCAVDERELSEKPVAQLSQNDKHNVTKATNTTSVRKEQSISTSVTTASEKKTSPTPETVAESRVPSDQHLNYRRQGEMSTVVEDSEMEKLTKLPIFQKPMCLISSDKSGMLSVEEEPMRQLEEIEYGLNVVAIAGLYRTGKSYLMNRLAYVKTGFALGNTAESKTKGIWVWCKIHPEQRNQVLVLLDTEGLGDALKGDIQHDNRIFTLAALLSSTLVYNMMGAFNQDAIEKLTFITEMSKNMKISNASAGDKYFDFVLPRFVLCLRDFFLNPEVDGRPITPDEYLEVCLKSRPVNTVEDEKYNRPRECIKQYFTRRKVMTFDRPGGKKVMTRLDSAHDDDLSEEFIDDTMKFICYVFQCEPKLLANRQPVTGSMLAKLGREYVKAMRDGSVPCVDDAMTTMCKMENRKAIVEAVDRYQEVMGALVLPILSNKEFLEIKYSHQKSLLTALNKRLVFDDKNEAEKKAEEEMEEIATRVSQKNETRLQELCFEKLKELYIPIEYNIKNGRYKIAGGFQMYKGDMTSLEKKFNEELSKVDYSERQNAFNQFLSERKSEGDDILENDQQMSKEDKERELQLKEEMNEKRMQEAQALLMRQIEEQKLVHEKEMLRFREEQRQKETAEMIKARDELLAARGKANNAEYINEMKRELERFRRDSQQGVLTRAWNYLFA